MIEGLVLGIVTWLSLILSMAKMPTNIKTWLITHPVLADLLATGAVFLLLTSVSKSLVAVVGAAIAGLLMNFTLYSLSKRQ